MQHGIAVGYYLSFLLGGFITSAARLARANIRPLLLPAPGQKASVAKKIYDILGIMASVAMVNYATVPFILLNFHDSIVAWRNLGFYGHILIFSSLAFFHSGGTKLLRRLQVKYNKVPPPRTNGVSTPKPMTVPPSLDEVVPPPKI